MSTEIACEMTAEEANDELRLMKISYSDVRYRALNFRDKKGWKALGYKSFEACIADHFPGSERHIYRLAKAAEIEEDILDVDVQSDQLVPNSAGSEMIPESRLRPLASLPKDDRKEAWQEAVAESNGKPTAAVVQAVVNRRRGKTTINGKHVEDPPDIAKARAEGRLPEEADIEIIEPDADEAPAEAVREEYEERKAIQEEISDEEWVAALPLFTQLEGVCRDRFVEDAILYRTLTAARKTFAHHATRAFNKVRRKGAYAFRLQSFLGISAPDKWLLCPTVDNEGCGGSGEIHLIGRCPKCHGRGYWIK